MQNYEAATDHLHAANVEVIIRSVESFGLYISNVIDVFLQINKCCLLFVLP